MAIVFSRLLVYLAFFPTFSRTKYRHFWHGNQGNPDIGYGDQLVQRDLSFSVLARSIFAIMGGSGCGKSTLLRALIGLLRPRAGSVLFRGEDYWSLDDAGRGRMGRRFGVLFQQGALWSTLTAAENVALPLQLFTALTRSSTTSTVTTLGATRRTSAA
jgi:phospholipid/cholesterol/gamma-HCH transport system ATP-binding protein